MRELAGIRLREWREEQELSQEGLAKLLNARGFEEVRQWHVSLIEHGKTEPRARLAADIEVLTKGRVRAGDDWLNTERKLAAHERARKRTIRAVGA